MSMNITRKITHYLLNAVFIAGWLGFFFHSVYAICVYYVPGAFLIMPKPADINFYVALFWQIVILFCYTKLFVVYFKRFFIEKITVKQKMSIIIKCIGWMLLMGGSYLFLMFVSCALGIAGVETAFWYSPE